VTKKFRLQIPGSLINEPIIYRMVTQYNLIPNILEAHLDPLKTGTVVVELKGPDKNLKEAREYLEQLQITIEEL